MVMIKHNPDVGELVICNVTDINPNSVYVSLVEYDCKGMIHVSEIANSWVKNISKVVKSGQTIVCLVRSNRGNILNLSIKRVKPTQKRAKITEWKNEKKADNILKFVANDLGIEEDQIFELIGYKLMDKFGNVYNALLSIVKEGETVLNSFDFDENYKKSLVLYAQKNIKLKKVIKKLKIILYCFDSDGVIKLKKILKDIDADVKFLSSSLFELSTSSIDPNEAEKKVELAFKQIEKNIVKYGAKCELKLSTNKLN
jgi:translation initiation factor 2 subunit 1